MKTKIVYICEHCNTEHGTSYHAEQCEAKHWGLTMREYYDYKELLENERVAFGILSCRSNPETRKIADDAVAAVIAFQNEHGFTDNR